MSSRSMRTAFVVFFAVLLAVFVAVALPFAKAAFLAATAAIIFAPLYKFILNKCRLHRYVAAIVTTVVIGACVIFPLAVLGTIVVTKAGNFIQGIGLQIESGAFAQNIRNISGAIHEFLSNISGAAPSPEDILATTLGAFKMAAKKFYEFSPRFISTSISIVVNFFLMLLFLVVFLAEGSPLYKWLLETSPLSSSHLKELARDVRLSITSSIIAALVIAIVQGSLLALGYFVAGFEQVLGWWLISMLLCVIPVVGAASCYIASSVFLFSSGHTHGAIAFLLYGFAVISTIDNVIRPFLLRGASKMHPLLIFVVIIGAMRLFGPIGLLVGPVFLSIFLASLRIYRREFAGQ